jgi:hypothetical protein
MKATSAVPIFQVSNVDASLKHYTSVFGFVEDFRFDNYAGVKLGDVRLHLSGHSIHERPIGGGTAYILCDEVDNYGNSNITDQLLKGVKLGDRTYKNHLDGYDQTDAITGKGPSKRHEIFYLGESTVGAVRIDDYKYRFIDQPNGWLGAKTQVDVPYLINLRLDPFERQGWPNNGTKEGAQQYFDWFKSQFWRFVFVQQVMGKELQTFLKYPPMQKGASFNLEAVKAEMAKKMEQAQAAAKGAGQ